MILPTNEKLLQMRAALSDIIGAPVFIYDRKTLADINLILAQLMNENNKMKGKRK